jgi:hypothetical protein
MLRLLSLATLVVLFAGCTSDEYTAPGTSDSYADYERYGDDAMFGETVSANALAMDGTPHVGREVAIEGTISEVCQTAGCWFVFQNDGGSVIRVHVPKNEDDEYSFTLPTDASGRHAVAYGMLEEKELTADEQAHYADESESGAAAPVEYRLVARSVLLPPTT